MKKILLLTLTAFLAVGTLFADKHEKGQSVDEALKTIRSEQGVSSDDQINPNKVSDENLEALGKAVMQEFHPDVRERSYMNQMMGGEGSANLKAMYRMMGYRYLLTDGQMGPGFGYGPMMGRGGYGPGYGRMMGGGYGPGFGRRYGYGPGRRGPGMMGDRWDHMDDWHYRGYFGGWWMWLIAIVLIGAVIYFAVKSYQKKGTGGSSNSLEILKERYAKGEITKEEYDSMKKDLKE